VFAGQNGEDSLLEIADRSDFVILCLSQGDVSDTLSNIIFELGFFVGRLGRSRVLVVYDTKKATTVPSALLGVPVFTTDPSTITEAAAAIALSIATIGARPDRVPSASLSCFISCSWNDREFSSRLRDDLQTVGVRTWLDAKEINTGELPGEAINNAIEVHDKLLLIISHASTRSSWVRFEVRKALQLEADRHKTILFPIRLDDTIFEVDGIQEIEQLKLRSIADFRHWQDSRDLYRRAFSQLVRDLTISASVEAGV
jgi:nucleoside 2-deoxyribosyltransferase